MKTPTQQSNAGFTIIETLVAITILMIAIAGPLTVVSKGLTAALYARDQMIGSYLAQDALEFLKNVRDNNKLAGGSITWLNGITNGSTCSQSSPCTVDTISGDPTGIPTYGIVQCSYGSPTCGQMYLVSSGDLGGYSHTVSGIKTQFTRTFYVTPSTANPTSEAKLVVTVSWKNGTVPNSVVLQNEIFDTYR
jgi:type II secretory pathway pseudopilin PulG